MKIELRAHATHVSRELFKPATTPMYVRAEMSTERGGVIRHPPLLHASRLIDTRAAPLGYFRRNSIGARAAYYYARNSYCVCVRPDYALLLLRRAAFREPDCVCFRTCSEPP